MKGNAAEVAAFFARRARRLSSGELFKFGQNRSAHAEVETTSVPSDLISAVRKPFASVAEIA